MELVGPIVLYDVPFIAGQSRESSPEVGNGALDDIVELESLEVLEVLDAVVEGLDVALEGFDVVLEVLVAVEALIAPEAPPAAPDTDSDVDGDNLVEIDVRVLFTTYTRNSWYDHVLIICCSFA